MRPTYRPDIDGLRAVAVSSVVLFHAYPKVFEGGYVGVDVFFVISGYLITHAILNNSDGNRFSIRDFYLRRVRRIFPALSLVFTATLIAGWILLNPQEFAQLGKHVASGAGFVSNLVLWQESGYFDTSAELKPLLHLWSLGVEEQFYIFFPVVMYLILRFRLPRFSLLAVLTIASLGASIVFTSSAPTAAFYNPATRVWEILIGALIADLSLRKLKVTTEIRSTHFMSIIGVALILCAFLFFDNETKFPGIAVFLPTLGAGLVILSGPQSLLNKSILSSRIFIFVGLISYPLYLWHWPILVFIRIENGSVPSALLRTFAIIVSVMFAYLTYRLVERPLRFRVRPQRAVAFLLIVMAVLATSGILTKHFDGFPSRFSNMERNLAVFNPDFKTDARAELCWLDQFASADAFSQSCTDARSQDQQIVLWGDSHAARLYPGLREAISSKVSISQYTRSSCPGILNMEFQECRDSNEEVIRRITSLRPQTVLLFGRWDTYLTASNSTEFSKKLDFTIQKLRGIGVTNIVILGPAPFWSGNLPTNLIDLLRESKANSLPGYTNFRLTNIAQQTEEMLLPIVNNLGGATYFSILKAMCSNEKCLVTVDGSVAGLTTWDYGHLTTPGAHLVATKLIQDFKDLVQ